MEENITVKETLSASARREYVFKMLFLGEFYPPNEIREQQEIYLSTLTLSPEQIRELFEKEEEAPTEAEELFQQVTKKPQKEVRITEALAAELLDRASAIREHIGEIDQILAAASVGWELDRIGKAELCILRLATYEILWDDTIPDAVAVNVAVELSKDYGQKQSKSFVNAILAKVVKKHEGV